MVICKETMEGTSEFSQSNFLDFKPRDIHFLVHEIAVLFA